MIQIKSIAHVSLIQLNHLYYTTSDRVWLHGKAVATLNGLCAVKATEEYVELHYEDKEPVRLSETGPMGGI